MKVRTKVSLASLTKVVRWNVHCIDGGHTTRIYVLAGDTYGRLLGFTPLSEWAVFDAWIDPVFEEVTGIVHRQLRREAGASDCIVSVLGAACDPAPSGYTYDFTGMIWCPVCGSSNTQYGPDDPLQFSMMSVPQVTHSAWMALSDEQRHMLINEALKTKKCTIPDHD